MKELPFSHPILSGETADVYFLRTKAILEAEGLNPVVTMEVFPNKPGGTVRDERGAGAIVHRPTR